MSKKLNQLAATAISGNDISASIFYLSALSIAFAGQYAWITLLIVSFVLFLYRKIYGEVVGAIPLNGGVYNALFTTTSKFTASFTATLSLLSFLAIAVISANEAIHYLHTILPSIPILPGTVILLAVIAFLTSSGVLQSSKIAIGFFVFHLFSMAILSGLIVFFLVQNSTDVFIENWQLPLQGGSIVAAIFIGFTVSILGISGFESSANYVESQERGVFPKTLRNMWLLFSITTPLMTIFALALFPIPVLQSDEYQNTLLLEMGKKVGGEGIASLIAIDAVLVLVGAVLSSFIGATGLLRRMALDRIIPSYFLKKNGQRGSYRIIIAFLLLCISLLFAINGNIKILAGVYTISFLLVLVLFGIGNMLLKIRRKNLPRTESLPLVVVFLAVFAAFSALIGNINMPLPSYGAPGNLAVFLYYFIPAILVMIILLNRTFFMRLFSKTINRRTFVFFTDGDILSLNRMLRFVAKNEYTKRIKIVAFEADSRNNRDDLVREIETLKSVYPEIDVEFVTEKNEFSPSVIKDLSYKWNIPMNYMFISFPRVKSAYEMEELKDVRFIV